MTTVMLWLLELFIALKDGKKINKDIYSIKERYGLPKNGELKWVKISNSNFNVYRALIEYFFSNNDLHFRAVIADKTNLNHKNIHKPMMIGIIKFIILC